jgi:hypothetical protein
MNLEDIAQGKICQKKKDKYLYVKAKNIKLRTQSRMDMEETGRY